MLIILLFLLVVLSVYQMSSTSTAHSGGSAITGFSSVNHVRLMGYVGAVPAIREMANGQKMATFSLATSEQTRSKEGEPEKTTQWHRIVVFNQEGVRFAENFVQTGWVCVVLCRRGGGWLTSVRVARTRVIVEGKLKYGSYEKDGVKHNTTDIVVGSRGDMAVVGGAVNGEERKD
jgi:single-strand DNA-binding protein